MTTSPARHRAAVLGSPIGHSLSPALHRAGFVAAGLAGWTFDAIDCDAARLPGLVGSLGAEWAGLAVTMPGKEAAAAFAAVRSERVEALGVANTLLRRRDDDGADTWWAENTDVDGIIGSLTAAGVTADGPVLLIGGGGTARAAVAGLAELGVRGPLVLAGRRPESTAVVARLAAGLGLETRRVGMSETEIAAVAGDVTLALSTVPAGAADHLAGTLAGVPALFDAIYHPWPTPLAAAGRGDRVTVTGLDMLLHQALRQFELITGAAAPGAAMRQALIDATGTDLALPLRRGT